MVEKPPVDGPSGAAPMALRAKGGRDAPGLRGWSAFRFLRHFTTVRAIDVLGERFEQHGDVFSVQLGPLRLLMVRHPEHCRHVLQANHKGYQRSLTYRRLKPFLGEGLVTSDGALWRQQRRLMQPAFSKARVEALAPAMLDEADRLVAAWSERDAREPLDVHEAMSHLTMRIACRTLFRADIGEAVTTIGAPLAVAIDELNRRTTQVLPLPLWVPTPANLRLRRARARLNAVVEGIIAERRAALDGRPEPGPDEPPPAVLDLLMQARDEDSGAGMSDAQLRDEVMTLFTAGHETTANLLSWTLHLLAQHPAVQSQVAAEARAASEAGALDAAAMPALGLTRQVLQESMRLFPPVWVIDREAIASDRLGPYEVRRGDVVVVCTWFAHRHGNFWSDPERFDPARFQDGGTERARRAYFPFGAGPRQCIGMDFALIEATLALASLMARFEVHPTPDRPFVMEPSITLRPKHGLFLRVAPRS